jgi:hypothetical protein
MNNKADFLNIKSWAAEDRPREKLVLKGKATREKPPFPMPN